MKLWERVAARSTRALTRLACVLALLGLCSIVYSILSPRALPVIFAMSVGHMIGGAGFACYLLAVLIDLARRPTNFSSVAPTPNDAPRDTETPPTEAS